MCTVRANGRAASACTQPIVQGMVVENDTEELRGLRRDLIDMLFVEGNHFCSVCEAAGACELQALAKRFGIAAPRYPYQFPVRALDSTHPEIFIDRNRCILCRRCVRASDEVDGKHVYASVGRGDARRVAVASFDGLGSTDAAADDRAVTACPTGALVVKNDAYRTPIGERRFERDPIGSEIERTGAEEGES